MRCENLKIELDTVPSLETDDPYFAGVVKHIQNCDACHTKLIKRLEAERSIKMALGTMAQMPETLVSSVINNTKALRPVKNRWRRWGAMAASVLLVVGLSASSYSYWAQLQTQSALKRLCAISIKNHEMHSEPDFVSVNAEQVATWLSKRLDRVVRVPEIITTSAVEGGRRCALGEYAAGVFHFEIGGKRSTLFSFYPQQFNVEGAVVPPKLDMGYTVAVWSEDGLGYSLVSEAPPDKVKALFVKAKVI
ncbi:hypothetical protein MNBD_NITROSPINAE01-1099 [hydrothermal vent metagenome]|uniref:Uncharacterized protein n=1 Tax=hydrothermal vent metagenome TaxID=652676 RepID=A0A3B1CJW0_9ZZZZ